MVSEVEPLPKEKGERQLYPSSLRHPGSPQGYPGPRYSKRWVPDMRLRTFRDDDEDEIAPQAVSTRPPLLGERGQG